MYIIINDEKERFVDAKYPNLKPIYEVSNYGNIRNKQTGRLRNILSRDQDGYVRGIFKAVDNSNIYIYIHRLVAYNFCEGFDPVTGRVYINHLDCIRDHNYYKNLEWVTTKENNQHAFKHGNATPNITHLTGEKNGMCKYSDVFIHKICKLFSEGKDVSDIMNKLGYERCYDNPNLYWFLRSIKERKARQTISSQYIF